MADLFELILYRIAASGIIKGTLRIFSLIKNGRLGNTYICQTANSRADLDDIVSVLGRYLDRDEVPRVSRLEQFWEIRPDIFILLHKWDNKKRQLKKMSGCAIIYPLKKYIVTKITSGNATVDDIKRKSIFKPKRIPAGYYIGFIWGESKKAQGYLLRHLIDTMGCAKKDCAQWVFARPTTKEALRFMKKNGFVSVSNHHSELDLLQTCKRELPFERTFKSTMIQAKK